MTSSMPAPAARSAAIELVGVTRRFSARAVLDDVNVAIAAGRTTVLLGPSGTGKSTLLRLATGLLSPDAGVVRTLGVDVFAAKKPSLLQLRRRMGMLFQDNALFGSLSVFDNIAFPLRRVARTPEADVRRRVDELLALVGLSGFGERLPDRLSGGQRKRVALARAIALEPELVLFDEPTSGLDPQTSASIDQLIRATQRRLGITFVVITHDIESAALIADDAGLLLDGKVHVFGDRATVWASTDPRVRAFLDRAPPAGAPR
ncbi:MAG: ATP-binding cassette domain-containing protein [Deltaproteobacteria bacterium]|nr:ATP-binding cassette domain-containing protein [Deltaproteobacteria bacterium]